MPTPHPAWDFLFHNPDFWDLLSKQHLCHLRTVCNDFHARIPEREALLRVFRDACMRKTDLFRLLPLTVHDVLRLRSPVRFADALQIAERKTKGFATCIAMVRERGLRLWRERGAVRAEWLHQIHNTLRHQSNGDSDTLLPPDHPVLLRAARTGCIMRVVFWRHTCTIADIICVDRFYHSLLTTMRHAYGHWYRGIHADVLAATRATLAALEADAPHALCVTFERQTLAVGVVVFAD
jgi:hypothetical protein